MAKYQQTQALLDAIEAQLQQLELWQSQPPSAAALASEQPFAVDTLHFHQWLQFILLPRMRALIDGRLMLPENIAISPMAAQVYQAHIQQDNGYLILVEHIRQLDVLLSGQDPLQDDDAAEHE
ncbi:YqcC family protein [Idiomarina xiamenensis]|uniref:YqcC-like domain-containing protein n=1 Tax=Idiomarina xiamenensis 10-D-4 TaxID=740709 RepID=K2JMW1_9GAMM|nr:YqcC family protein [Idiomarina xiamenensis]EKE84856.1 hypothetical protein A10D4_04570 [Idiomarina xiamenensis 10-D-4]